MGGEILPLEETNGDVSEDSYGEAKTPCHKSLKSGIDAERGVEDAPTVTDIITISTTWSQRFIRTASTYRGRCSTRDHQFWCTVAHIRDRTRSALRRSALGRRGGMQIGAEPRLLDGAKPSSDPLQGPPDADSPGLLCLPEATPPVSPC